MGGPDRNSLGVAGGALIVLIALIILVTRLTPIWGGYDPWIDESMLLSSFPLESWAALFRPLPLFEQATPLGHAVLLHITTGIFPQDAVMATRLVSAMAGLTAAGFLYATLRRVTIGDERVLALSLICLSPFIIRYSLEIKPYIFDYLSTCMVMYAGARLIHARRVVDMAVFVTAGVFAVVFSFTAPLVIGALGIGVAVQRWADSPRGFVLREHLTFALVLAFLAAAFLACYFLYTRPVTALQFASWNQQYQRDFLVFPPLSLDALRDWLALPLFMFQQLDPLPGWVYSDYPQAPLKWIMLFFFSAVMICGISAMGRRRIYLPSSLGAAAFLIFGLNLAGILPISFVRHFTFIMPITGIIFACGIVVLLRWLLDRISPVHAKRTMALVLACSVILYSARGLYRSTTLAIEEVSPLIAHIQADDHADAPVWVYLAAQPAMRVLAPEGMSIIGNVDHVSNPVGFFFKHQNFPSFSVNEAYVRKFREDLRGRDFVWMYFLICSWRQRSRGCARLRRKKSAHAARSWQPVVRSCGNAGSEKR